MLVTPSITIQAIVATLNNIKVQLCCCHNTHPCCHNTHPFFCNNTAAIALDAEPRHCCSNHARNVCIVATICIALVRRNCYMHCAGPAQLNGGSPAQCGIAHRAEPAQLGLLWSGAMRRDEWSEPRPAHCIGISGRGKMSGVSRVQRTASGYRDEYIYIYIYIYR
jgi:hypothetical protein